MKGLKKRLVNIAVAMLALIMLFAASPLSSFALSAEEEEDIYRVDTEWQSEFNQKYIAWLLNSDNFLYHLDVTEGNIVQDFSYGALNINPLKRQENFRQIIAAIIDYTYSDVSEVAAVDAAREVQSDYLSWLADASAKLLNDGSKTLKLIVEAIKAEKEALLDSVYIPGETSAQLYYTEIYNKIYSRIDDPALREEAKGALESLKGSNEWLKDTKKYYTALKLTNMGVNIIKDSLDCAVELRTLKKADENFIELLRYIEMTTEDDALAAACAEVERKILADEGETLVRGIAEAVAKNAAVDLGLDKLKDIISKSNVFARAIILGYEAGTLVSDWLFNTTDMKKHMQSAYCINEVSEALVPLLREELSNLHYYDRPNGVAAKYAKNTIMHMKSLISLRRAGEESYYSLKDSVYHSFMIEVIVAMKLAESSHQTDKIEAWHDQFLEAMDIAEKSLFKMIPKSYYYSGDDLDDSISLYEVEDGVLIRYNGGGKSAYVSSNIHTIAEGAFSGLLNLEKVEIYGNCSLISSGAFSNCPSLGKISIHNRDAVIEDGAFSGCNPELIIFGYDGSTAERYAVGHGITFVSIDSIYGIDIEFYDPDFVIENRVLKQYVGSAREIYIPYGVSEIASGAFLGNQTAEYISIPDTVIQIGASAFANCSSLVELYIPRSVEKIGDTVCEGCTALEAISVNEVNESYYSEGNCLISKKSNAVVLGCKSSVIPDGVLVIGYRAFAGALLESVVIPSSVEYVNTGAFEGCSMLKNLVIEDGVEEILPEAFSGCSAITEIYLPNSITAMGKAAFAGCNRVKKITMPIIKYWYRKYGDLLYLTSSIANEPGELFTASSSPNSYLPASLKTVILTGEDAYVRSKMFYGCEHIEKIELGDGIKSIGSEAFAECSSLSSVSLGGATYIDTGAFKNSAITSIAIGSKVKNIGQYVFSGCSALRSVSLIGGISDIPDYAFEYCTSLASITLPNSISSIGTEAFAYCSALESIIIPAGVEYIDGDAFVGCSALTGAEYEGGIYLGSSENPHLVFYKLSEGKTEIHISESTKIIYDRAFSSSAVESVKIPNSVKRINEYAFSGCESLAEITLGLGVSTICPYAFENCPSLQRVYYAATSDEWERIDIYSSGNADFLSAELIFHIHEYKSWITLGEEGHQASCEGCGKIKQLPHEWSEEWTVDREASCAVNGEKSKHCTACNERSEIIEIIAAHKWSEEWTVDREASCTVNGEKSKHCTACNERSEITEIPAAHKWGEDWTVDREASCTVNGEKSKHCTVCNERSEITEIPAAHKWSEEWKLDREASCTVNGEKSKHCTACNERSEITEIIAAHKWSEEWTLDREASCTVNGEKSKHCTACNERSEIIEIIAAHKWSEDWTVDREASCTVNGEKSKHCTACNERIEITEIIAAHKWSEDWTVDLKPTETEEGSKSRHCKTCDEKRDVTAIPMLKPSSPVTDFKYRVINNEIVIENYLGTSETVSIPAYIDGLPVTKIAAFAFSDNKTIVNIVIPYTVNEIEYYAFYGCTALESASIGEGVSFLPRALFSGCINLKSVELPSSLVEIGDSSFYNCTSLAKIAIPDGVWMIGATAFYNCEALSEISLPASVERIGERAFYKTPWISSLTGDVCTVGGGVLIKMKNEFGGDLVIPEGVVSIYSGGNTFENTYVGEVIIPSTLKYWDQAELELTASAYTVGSDSQYFKSILGVLYTADGKVLAAFPSKREGKFTVPTGVLYIGNGAFYNSLLSAVTFPEGLISIGNHAFYFATEIERIILPDSVCELGSMAFCSANKLREVRLSDGALFLPDSLFFGCSSLASIYIGSKTEEIDYSVFYGCSALSSVSFGGSRAEWAKIKIASVGNDALTALKPSCMGDLQAFRDGVAAIRDIEIGKELYLELYSLCELYRELSDEEKASVAHEAEILNSKIQEYNLLADKANAELDSAIETAFIPAAAFGFSFLAALIYLIKRKLIA